MSGVRFSCKKCGLNKVRVVVLPRESSESLDTWLKHALREAERAHNAMSCCREPAIRLFVPETLAAGIFPAQGLGPVQEGQ